MNELPEEIWNKAVRTLYGMCLADMENSGPTKRAFVMTLRVYANNMEKLLKPDKAQAAQHKATLHLVSILRSIDTGSAVHNDVLKEAAERLEKYAK